MKQLGELIREYRKSKRLTLSAFGDTCDFSASMISDIENGRRIPRKKETIKKLAKSLSKSYEEIEKSANYSNVVYTINNSTQATEVHENVVMLARKMFSNGYSLSNRKIEKIIDIMTSEEEESIE